MIINEVGRFVENFGLVWTLLMLVSFSLGIGGLCCSAWFAYRTEWPDDPDGEPIQ